MAFKMKRKGFPMHNSASALKQELKPINIETLSRESERLKGYVNPFTAATQEEALAIKANNEKLKKEQLASTNANKAADKDE